MLPRLIIILLQGNLEIWTERYKNLASSLQLMLHGELIANLTLFTVTVDVTRGINSKSNAIYLLTMQINKCIKIALLLYYEFVDQERDNFTLYY